MSTVIEAVGWAATVSLALSGVPFAWSTYKAGKTDMSLSGILMILGGMAGMLVFELGTARSIQQVADFALTTVCWSTVLWYKLNPRTVVASEKVTK